MPVKRWIEEVKVLVEAQPKTVVMKKVFSYFQTRRRNIIRLAKGGSLVAYRWDGKE